MATGACERCRGAGGTAASRHDGVAEQDVLRPDEVPGRSARHRARAVAFAMGAQ